MTQDEKCTVAQSVSLVAQAALAAQAVSLNLCLFTPCHVPSFFSSSEVFCVHHHQVCFIQVCSELADDVFGPDSQKGARFSGGTPRDKLVASVHSLRQSIKEGLLMDIGKNGGIGDESTCAQPLNECFRVQTEKFLDGLRVHAEAQ